MDSQRQQAAERIKQANNILVTVSSNPSVDQLAACIGLTLTLNKMGKHATAVFSGQVPSTLEFLQPEKTIEKNTDSLRDFIIALDKSKADKLRYKVEDRVVKIFITPYRTSISQKDLEFSQGDFNVDVVLALGVHNQAELDQAITSHGRILHDAAIITVNIKPGGELGTINWLDPRASSLSELAVELMDMLDRKLIDGQIATAMLTGIVAETERFSNAKTTPQTMSISAELMAAGANQQLVATKLEEPAPPPAAPAPIAHQQTAPKEPTKKTDDGTLEITHDTKETGNEPAAPQLSEEEQAAPAEPASEPQEPELPEPEPPKPAPQIHIDEHGALEPATTEEERPLLPPRPRVEPGISRHNESPKMILEPPTLGGQLTASASPENFEEERSSGLPGIPPHDEGLPPSMVEDKIEVPSVGPTIVPPSEEDEPQNAPGTTFLGDQPIAANDQAAAPAPSLPQPGETLSDIERDVHSSHLDQSLPPVDSASSLPPLAPATGDTPPAAPAWTPPTEQGSPDIPIVPPSSEGQSATTSAAPEDMVTDARDAVAAALGSPVQPPEALNANFMNVAPNAPSTPAAADISAVPDMLAGQDATGVTTALSLPATPVEPWTPPADTPPTTDGSEKPPDAPPPLMPLQ